jgi:hypothetical protein
MLVLKNKNQPVLNPLEDKSSEGTRKLPAAAFTRMSSLPKCLKVDSTTLIASSLLRTSPSNPIACNVHNNKKVFTSTQTKPDPNTTNYPAKLNMRNRLPSEELKRYVNSIQCPPP